MFWVQFKENVIDNMANVETNEASLDAIKHQLVSCFLNRRDVTNNIKNHLVITLNPYILLNSDCFSRMKTH